MKWFVAVLALTVGMSQADEASVDEARDALGKKESDIDSTKVLEEVFQAAEKSYTLLKKGERTLTYGFDYSLVKDQRLSLITIAQDNGRDVYGLVGRQNETQHTFTNSFTFDSGIWDNLTFSVRLPLVAKYDTDRDINAYSLGDISLSLRWQPWAALRGKPVTTFYTTVGLPTGDSPYKTNLDKDIATGSGYYSLGFGTNMSYIIDPVVLYGSLGYTWNFDVHDVHQDLFTGTELNKVSPGNVINFNMGMAYALSYDVSLAASYQMAYSLKSRYHTSAGTMESSEQTSSIMNFSLGMRAAPNYIINVNAGFGLTDDSPDVLLGVSLPLDIKGLKAQ